MNILKFFVWLLALALLLTKTQPQEQLVVGHLVLLIFPLFMCAVIDLWKDDK